MQTTPALSARPVPDWALFTAEPTVLIADDDPDLLELMTFKLRAAGYRTLVADNGADALALVQTELPDLVVLDVSMPGLDGLTVCHYLHSAGPTAQIPILMLSGRARRSDIDLGYTAGADDYLTKPFSPRDLVERVRRLLTADV